PRARASTVRVAALVRQGAKACTAALAGYAGCVVGAAYAGAYVEHVCNEGSRIMNVAQLMTSPAATCRSTDTLNRAAQIMWERDCGTVPVVDDEGRPIATVTDRDICMATYTQGRALPDIPVSLAMSQTIVTCHKDEPLAKAESLMRTQKIRRLPVVDDDGRVVGILSLSDIATHARLAR